VFQIGDSLREARARRGFTPADVHKAIRIRERYLTALEEERWDMLPGEAYTKGFLRTYAEYLGLNGQLYVDEYNARVARHDDEGAPIVTHATVEGRRRMPGRGILLAFAAVVIVGGAVAGLAAWQLGGSSSAPPARGSGSISVSVQTSPATTKTPQTTPSVPTTTAAASKPVFTSITASRGRCWVLVRAGGPHGAIVYQGTLDQGEVKTFHFTTRLWVRLGDPTSVDVTLAGKPVTDLPTSPSNVILTRSGATTA
jgi:cytoskeletal protein RodZ